MWRSCFGMGQSCSGIPSNRWRGRHRCSKRPGSCCLCTGVAGSLVVAAVVMFAVNIAMTLRTRAEKFARGLPVKLTTRIAELLEVYPEMRPVLIHGGLAGLAAMRQNPPRFVTLDFAARRH